jgi:hypothetical protein
MERILTELPLAVEQAQLVVTMVARTLLVLAVRACHQTLQAQLLTMLAVVGAVLIQITVLVAMEDWAAVAAQTLATKMA